MAIVPFSIVGRQYRRGTSTNAAAHDTSDILFPPSVLATSASTTSATCATSSALLYFFAALLLLVLSPSPCFAGSGTSGDDNDSASAAQAPVGEQLGVPLAVIHDVEVFKPSSYVESKKMTVNNDKNASSEEMKGHGRRGGGPPIHCLVHNIRSTS